MARCHSKHFFDFVTRAFLEELADDPFHVVGCLSLAPSTGIWNRLLELGSAKPFKGVSQ
jgi:hypothetical protein